MFISEFHSRFMSNKEKSYLFDALRRVSCLEKRGLLEEEPKGWPEWPPPDPGNLRLQLRKA